MTHLIFDTETTGFYNPKLAATDKLQARVIQLAAIKLDDDLNEIGVLNTLIKPEPWYRISEGAFNTHGISLEQCEKEGRPQKEVMVEFLYTWMAECSNFVAHNIMFDFQMVSVEMVNSDRKDKTWDPTYKKLEHHHCTMNLMTPICRLPQIRRNSFGSLYKWPKLREAMAHISKPFIGREHDGLSDARACAEVYRWLILNKYLILKQPTSYI